MKEETNSAPGSSRIDVAISGIHLLDQALNSAETSLMPHARRQRTGILISRQGPGQYIVETSAAVPYGLTYQRAL
ncbi:hypothetical protein FCN77_12895 [Arthrobacter sp. 24S4-2]|uniref:hypothetical protein n=1 Tax=Arthrobacter sp. 24S4-2 TaxID=2575374 RepID=UPI0010C77915|nr:hypothetical protein [Arthrobacter sp. 24S4-2]QCO98422.1 hypothetical protein FCN77_12895 [Arthrobacter sp. 24S4-2]